VIPTFSVVTLTCTSTCASCIFSCSRLHAALVITASFCLTKSTSPCSLNPHSVASTFAVWSVRETSADAGPCGLDPIGMPMYSTAPQETPCRRSGRNGTADREMHTYRQNCCSRLRTLVRFAVNIGMTSHQPLTELHIHSGYKLMELMRLRTATHLRAHADPGSLTACLCYAVCEWPKFHAQRMQ
jgi:hypothetical protein